mgnify:FL=1
MHRASNVLDEKLQGSDDRDYTKKSAYPRDWYFSKAKIQKERALEKALRTSKWKEKDKQK